MTEHSPEAIAAYPHDGKGKAVHELARLYGLREGFDRGRVSRKVADREALAMAFSDHADRALNLKPDHKPLHTEYEAADAILASGTIREAAKPAVDVETLRDALPFTAGMTETERADTIIAALIAPDGIIRDEREVKAEALEALADTGWFEGLVAARIRDEAAEIREGRA